MGVLDGLEPREVFHWFEELSAIPRGSGNTRAVSNWCAAFGRERGLECHQDGLGNVILIKPATPGYEGAAPLILQGHLDMVCEKEPACPKDMARDGLDLAVEGDYVSARGTTLGGDDGIAVAMALAILDSGELPHPRLEAVFTVDEEVGMLGAAGLDVAPLQGRTLLNLDSEDEGVFTVSCAGGNVTRCVLPVDRAPFDGAGLEIRVDGLQGGHSGTEIHKGRANADVLLGRLLRAAAARTEVRLYSAEGGLKDNAIPVQAAARIVAADPEAARSAVEALAAALREEHRVTDPGLTVAVGPREPEGLPLDGPSTRRALCLLTCAPNGVQSMSADIPGLVQTSLNLGILTTGERELSAAFCVRSSVDSQKEMLKDRLSCLMEQLGGRAEFSGDCPGWAFRADSPLRERMVAIFRAQYGHEPKVEAIHAGVECGLLAGKLPGLDCVSIGPELLEIHTPRERMGVASVQRTWTLVTELLRQWK